MEKNMLSSVGRIGRLTYWSRVLVGCAIHAFTFILWRWDKSGTMALIHYIMYVLIIIFIYIQAIKRMHDVNKSGWYCMIPIYGFILLFIPGTVGPNKYGEDPLDDKGILNSGKS